MPLSKEKIEQIFEDAQKLPQNDTLAPIINKMKDIKGDVISLLIYAYKAGATAEAEKALCLIEALEKIAYGYDNDDSRPGVHIGYSGAQSIATAALQEYTNSLK